MAERRDNTPLILAACLLGSVALGAILWLGSSGGQGPEGVTAPEVEAPEPVRREDVAVTPERFRKEGQTYAVKLLSNLSGRASNEDWGLATVVNVNYVVTLRYDEAVIESKPNRLVVERHFRELRHRLFTTVEDLDLSEDMKRAWQLLDYAAMVDPMIGRTATLLEKGASKAKEKLLAETKRLGLNWGPVLEKLGRDPSSSLRSLSSRLEGRKVRLLWTKGGGVSVLSGADGLEARERRLLERAALLADGALFPNKNKRRGERWKVEARHFADFLDVGLDGSLRGQVAIRREADVTKQGQRCAALRMLGGTISVVRDDQDQELRGALTPTGTLYYDLDNDLIREARLSGKAKARFESRDHLLFKARFRGTPSFSVSYEAQLK